MLAKYAVDFAKEHPFLLAIHSSYMILQPLNDVALPHLYGKVVESVQKKNMEKVSYYITLTIGLFMIIQMGYASYDLIESYITPAFQKFLNERIFTKILANHEHDADAPLTGKLIAHFVRVPGMIINWFNRIKDFIVPLIISYIVSIIYFWKADRLLGISLLIAIVLLYGILLSTPNRCKSASVESNDAFTRIYDEFDDMLQNMTSIHAENSTAEEMRRMDQFNDTQSEKFKKMAVCIFRNKFVAFPIIVGFMAFFVIRASRLVFKGDLSSGRFVALIMNMTSIVTGLSWVVDIIRDIVQEWGVYSNTEDILSATKKMDGTRTDEKTGVNSDKIEKASVGLRGIKVPYPSGLGLYNVNYTYPSSKKRVLVNKTIHIEPNEKVIIWGKNGSGKSTLLKILLGKLKPDSGDAYLNGRWYSEMDVASIRKEIGYVPQAISLFNRTILENILYGNRGKTEADVWELIDSLGLREEFESFPEKLQTEVGKNGMGLSGGQRQLVWCLRVLLHNPSVVIFDEPSSAFDVKRKEWLVKIIRERMKNKTVIVVSHDKALLGLADRIIYLDKASLEEEMKAH